MTLGLQGYHARHHVPSEHVFALMTTNRHKHQKKIVAPKTAGGTTALPAPPSDEYTFFWLSTIVKRSISSSRDLSIPGVIPGDLLMLV